MKDGTWVTAQYSDGSTPSMFKKGEKVSIIYKEDDPKSYVIISEKLKSVEKVFLVTGVLLLSYSGYYFSQQLFTL